ncbi:hypothetical protein RND81_12G059800 [Saponaria officinalis]|uniref:Uncharacterized protein n=1 Tax=Saponaria officinalis TaxID=3572 RepID=A0AAW1H5B9_SAPOF
MANGAWFSTFSSSSVNFLPAGVSDHSPVLVTIMAAEARPRRFSFLNCWTTMPGYHALVQDKWDLSVTGSSFYKFLARLKNVRAGLHAFHKSNTSGIQVKLSLAKSSLEASSLALNGQPTCPILQRNHRDALHSHLKLKQAEISILSQKAKADGIINNDSNTQAFYARIKARHQSQVISEITDHQGVHRTGSAHIVEGFLSFYQHLLGNSIEVQALESTIIATGPVISPSAWSNLVRVASNDEIKVALFSIDPQSNPGPDGFSSGFFISSWDLIEADMCGAIREFF